MTRVLVLGGSGMLGSTLVACLAADPDLEVHATARAAALSASPLERLGPARWSTFDAESDDPGVLPPADWAVNAIGVTKTHLPGRETRATARAIAVNAAFPHRLARWAAATGARVVQIATDCAFSGATGAYPETAAHDALDVYGKTKSLGEVDAPGFYNLRCSIVGLEPHGRRSLLEWFLSHPRGGTAPGFTNHLWNGIPTLHFARLVRGLLRDEGALGLSNVQHVVPADTIAKADLLALFARCYGREDVTIARGPAAEAIDRTLVTTAPARNLALWRAAGYDAAPTIGALVEELAGWTHPLRAREGSLA